MRRLFFVLILCLSWAVTTAVAEKNPRICPDLDAAEMNRWVDAVMERLSVEERIGQLFVAGVETDTGNYNRTKIKELIEKYHVGGLLFSKGVACNQARLTRDAQTFSHIPLLITMDGEWGLAMRLSDTPTFPRNMTLGAVRDDSLIYAYGREMGRACRRMGIHANFAPVLDVNSNPQNPVIGNRSFGEDADLVSRKAIAYACGLEDEGVMSVGKHFPGHGDTHEDSHKTLPMVARSRAQLDSCDLKPFRNYIAEGLSGLMVAHLRVPALDTIDCPTSLSASVVTDLLQKRMGFEGLIFTDALEMKGAVSETPALDALLAGNDVLLKPLDLPKEYNSIVAAYKAGELKASVIDEHCRKILRYKYMLGVTTNEPIRLDSLVEEINTPEARKLIHQLSAQAVTVLKNEEDLLPYTGLAQSTFGVVSIGRKQIDTFIDRLQEYAPVSYEGHFSPDSDDKVLKSIAKTLSGYNRPIIAIFSARDEEVVLAKKLLSKIPRATLVFFTTPYRAARYADLITQADAVVVAYESGNIMQECVAETLFGGNAACGQLPVSIDTLYRRGDGLLLPATRLGHATPEEVGVSSAGLQLIDSIAMEGIDSMAYPGCQILVARRGKIIYERVLGHFDYAKTHTVEPTDLYDLASITKAMGTLPAVMWLHDHEQIRLDAPLCFYLPEMRDYGLTAITLRQTLMHESGLPAGISLRQLLFDPDSCSAPLLKRGRDSDYRIRVDKEWYAHKDCRLKPSLVQDTRSRSYPIPIARNMYGERGLGDTIWHNILSVTKKDIRYKYSDLNFVILQKIVESVSGETLDHFIDSRILQPLGAYNTTYRPLQRFARSRIAPTEEDNLFRRQLVVGYPHDELACFMGGVSGNAGLFSNTRDMAKILQMIQNGGEYGGEEYFEPTTVHEFTTEKSSLSRRGLGFDKPNTEDPDKSPTCAEAPAAVYGHTGYTGTAFWVDPDNELIYIFLCNRVYPHRWNTRLMDMNIRTRIQSVIYQSLL